MQMVFQTLLDLAEVPELNDNLGYFSLSKSKRTVLKYAKPLNDTFLNARRCLKRNTQKIKQFK